MATSTIDLPARQVQLVTTRATNKTCNAGSSATLTATNPSVPAGFTNLGMVDAWFDGNETESPQNTTDVICVNHYPLDGTYKVVVRNVGTSMARGSLVTSFLLARG